MGKNKTYKKGAGPTHSRVKPTYKAYYSEGTSERQRLDVEVERLTNQVEELKKENLRLAAETRPEAETFTKKGVSENECVIQSYARVLPGIKVPLVYEYNKDTETMKMQKISGSRTMSVSDFYGENPEDVYDEDVFEKIRKILKVLYKNNIEYKDITGYNFVKDDNNDIWIIDFEHAKMGKKPTNDFMLKFINGYNGWNPEFL